MAGMFYSIKEAADKLGKSEDEIRQLVKAGRLREFRDGPNLLFKVDEVASLMSDTSAVGIKKEDEKPEAPQTEGEAEEILLASETPEKPGEEIQLTDADTQIVEEGIKVLGETDTASALKDTGASDETFKGLSGTPAPGKEASLEEIEKDVSLDTFGSGSGLLDLSLQADDTSLGGILDEIYAPGGEGKQGAPDASADEPIAAPRTAEGSAMEVAAEAEQIISEAQFPSAPAAVYAEPEPDAMGNAMGVMLFIPLLAVIYTAIVAVSGFSFVTPVILKSVQSLIWYVAIGLGVASGIILAIGAVMGSEKKPKAPKPPKVKKEKPPKPAKEKKGK
jgi:excisionase family DNA binding protein